MSEFPNDDKDLIHFLRQHRTQIPPASPDLEKRILQDVQASPMQVLRPSSRLWLVPGVIAASLVAAVVGYRALAPTQPSAAEVASLETFIESNWQCIINVSPERDRFF
ncbi:hypothetical protein [Brasilonema sp. UFV-L1]|uniref:hypothetical protein n=1 Tax=Brasilonema sp. UFV-L1 TaxID=2234130 RepID=UPI00145F2722|nr:hypothetical protein [Brasilonema sp. UFV-L1]NMG09130.1 hypothetical protein [Brasilonema sp. UFV-L1]